MSIKINNNLHAQSYNPNTKSDKTAPIDFVMADMEDASVTDEAEAQATSLAGVDSNGMLQEYLRSKIQMIPSNIGMTTEELLKYQEARTAKIVFDFGEDGSISIKEGLSAADYARAKAALNNYEFWLNGGTLSK